MRAAPPHTGQHAPGGIIGAPCLHVTQSSLHLTVAQRRPKVCVNKPISRHSPS